ncbi:hypothetical protein AVEN_130983-1 [Araneus ventricosus]|uniref:Uncharacterized protein n=1 Tax=Araneus ventricosus TaxID=182803 RepID=A0A4Y2NX09_ARAVE|nr:hypothetical protein AVEN_130983-1 [Araneus ventricosus]
MKEKSGSLVSSSIFFRPCPQDVSSFRSYERRDTSETSSAVFGGYRPSDGGASSCAAGDWWIVFKTAIGNDGVKWS